VTRAEPRPFYRPVVEDALRTLGYDPATAGDDAWACLALTLKDGNELAALAVAIMRELYTYMVNELADDWADWLAEMVLHARTDGRKYYFPGWTLT
jgi:hypothetical protein